jgi:hypothetical protein
MFQTLVLKLILAIVGVLVMIAAPLIQPYALAVINTSDYCANIQLRSICEIGLGLSYIMKL